MEDHPRSNQDAERPQTWHHGLVAEWWAAFNDGFRVHELDYYRQRVAEYGEPVLDVGCGTGRLLVPMLRDGVDIDGADASADMVAVCREKVRNAGLETSLAVQPIHAVEASRSYRTIIVCGTFGLGSTRELDMVALRRLRDLLEPGGTLLVDLEMPYADPGHWSYWMKDPRALLPEASEPSGRRRLAPDGTEYSMTARILSVDPLEQRAQMAIEIERWRNGALDVAETHTLDIGMYFKNEMLMMLHAAGFGEVDVHGEHEARPPTPDDDFLVFVARS